MFVCRVTLEVKVIRDNREIAVHVVPLDHLHHKVEYPEMKYVNMSCPLLLVRC